MSIVSEAEKKSSNAATTDKESAAYIESLRKFLDNPEQPVSKLWQINPIGKRNSEDIENFVNNFVHDTKSGMIAISEISDLMTENFNHEVALNSIAKQKVEDVTSLSIDAVIINKSFSKKVFVAGDDFVDRSKINRQVAPVSTAHIRENSGKLTLEPQDAVNHSRGAVVSNISFNLTSGIPKITMDNKIKSSRVYEGKLFAMAGEAQPTGGTLRMRRTTVDDERQEMEVQEEESVNEQIEMPTVAAIIGEHTDEDFEKERSKIVDNNPDTFWQAEYVVEDETTLSQGLVANIEIDLKKEVVANWINLDPMNFGFESWLTVENLSIRSTTGEWESVSNVNDGQHANIITDETNSILTDRQANTTLSANRFNYSGEGLWIFSPKKIRFIRLTIKQSVPIPVEYETTELVLRKSFNHTSSHSSFLGGTDSQSGYTKYNQKVRPINYYDTLGLQFSDLEFSDISGETQSKTWKKTDKKSWFGDGERTHVYSDSGWQVVLQKSITNTEKERYAIGIRDINVFGYSYANKSEIESTTFSVPANIKKISLDVSDHVPPEFDEKRYIKYYISAGGSDWMEINPTSKKPYYSEDGLVPKIYNINREEPLKGNIESEEPVREVKIKIEISRPDQLPYYTPFVNSYKLRMYTE